MRDFTDQLEKLKKEGITFSSEDLPRNSLGYVENYPLEFDAWVKRVETIITKYFSTSSAQHSLLGKGLKYYEGIAIHKNPEFIERTRDTLLKCIDMSIKSLESDDFEEITYSPIKGTKVVKSNKIFIVHGHDEQIKNELARFLEKLELEPIILHERFHATISFEHEFGTPVIQGSIDLLGWGWPFTYG